MSPSTLTPISHENRPDGEPTFVEEISRVIEGSVENLIPFGSEKSSVVKKESATEEIQKTQEDETDVPILDWFGMVPDMNETSTQAPEIPNLDWLKMILNHQRIMNQQEVQPSTVEVVEDDFKPAQTSNFASKYQQWQAAKNLATNWFEPPIQKGDQYSSAQKSKLNWSKILAEPLNEDNKQQYNIPFDNAVQWSSNEVTNNDMLDVEQKQVMIPPIFLKNKEQWFGESEM